MPPSPSDEALQGGGCFEAVPGSAQLKLRMAEVLLQFRLGGGQNNYTVARHLVLCYSASALADIERSPMG
eukprot:2092066-Alexandrium_andersonii.AAC.1